MGGSSSSSTSRTYNTTNVSQQGEGANVVGDGNTTTVYRADAITLDNIAAALAAGVEDLTEAGTKQVEAALGANVDVSTEALKRNESVSRAALQFSENSSQQAMDFVSHYTERAQIGSEGEQLRTLQYVAAAVAVALVGIAWASRGRA